MEFLARGKKVGAISCDQDDKGRVICTFQELGKGENAAVFEIIAAVAKDGMGEMIRFKSINKKPIDPDSLKEAQRIVFEQLMEKVKRTTTI